MPEVPGDPGDPQPVAAPLAITLMPGGLNGGPEPVPPPGLSLYVCAEVAGQRILLLIGHGDNTEDDDGREVPWSSVAWYQVVGTPPAARRLVGCPWTPCLPFPDGSVGRGDRAQLAGRYRARLY